MGELKNIERDSALQKINPFNKVLTSRTAPAVSMSIGLLIGFLSVISINSPLAILGAFGMPVSGIFMITGLTGFMTPDSLKTKKRDDKETIVVQEAKKNISATLSSPRENTPILPVTLFGENK